MSEEKNKIEAESPEDLAIGRVVRAATAEGLERQRGRAAAAFRERIQNAEFRKAGRAEAPLAMKIWAGTASALAACLTVVLTAQFVTSPPQAHPEVALTPRVPVVDQVMYTRNVDGGTIVLDDQTPVRVVKQQQIKQTEWFDAQEKARYSVTQPVETVQYQRVQPY
jgi:hypothetical protein